MSLSPWGNPPPPIQFQRNGTGFVLHKVMLSGRKHSVWFDQSGRAVDAERVFPDGSTMSVPERWRNVWEALEHIGKAYVGRAA